MGIPWREGKLGIDWDINSPWWEFLEFDPYLSTKEHKFLKKYNLKKSQKVHEWDGISISAVIIVPKQVLEEVQDVLGVMPEA